MSDNEFEIKPVHLPLKVHGGVPAPVASELALGTVFVPVAAAIREFFSHQQGRFALGSDTPALIEAIEAFLTLATSLDVQYGPDSDLPTADAGDVVDQALRGLAELDRRLDPLGFDRQRPALHATVLGIGYWAMRHHLLISAAEPIVNALAERANGTASRQEAAATYALMQGFIAHFKPHLGADVERSNPERPWRLLNLNFAITAIRTGDPAMMEFAFATLNKHLPEESAGFYAEAQSLACQPGFPEETRARIEAARLANEAGWTRLH